MAVSGHGHRSVVPPHGEGGCRALPRAGISLVALLWWRCAHMVSCTMHWHYAYCCSQSCLLPTQLIAILPAALPLHPIMVSDACQPKICAASFLPHAVLHTACCILIFLPRRICLCTSAPTMHTATPGRLWADATSTNDRARRSPEQCGCKTVQEPCPLMPGTPQTLASPHSLSTYRGSHPQQARPSAGYPPSSQRTSADSEALLLQKLRKMPLATPQARVAVGHVAPRAYTAQACTLTAALQASTPGRL